MTAKEIAGLFEELELRLIASLKRNLKSHKEWEAAEGFPWPSWQAEKIRNMERFRKENQRILAEYRSIIDDETAALLQEQFEERTDSALANLPDGVKAHSIEPLHFFGVDHPKMNALLEDIEGTFHKAESATLRLMDDVYRKTIIRAETALSSGSTTLPQAVDMATKDFLTAGINSIEYKNGKRVNIASYAEMALRTAATRAKLRGEATRRQKIGVDTVLVSQYGACSETCQPWQGRVYIDDVWGDFHGLADGERGQSINGNWYPLLSVAIRGGLFHPNCRHTLTTWVEGVSSIPRPMDAEKTKQASKLEAKQRALEREIRKWKRMAEGTMQPEQVEAYKRKAKDAQTALREFINEHGDVLRRDYWREQTLGVPLAKSHENGIINIGDQMTVSVNIDKLTPCLIEVQSGRIVPTVYTTVDRQELKGLKKQGWLFNWQSNDFAEDDIYKLTLAGESQLQGLVALQCEERSKAVYVHVAESAPQNRGANKQYEGVGGHLFAIAAKVSLDKGYGGFVFMDAKNVDLVRHYTETLGAQLIGIPHPYRMIIDEEAAMRLLSSYTVDKE